MNTVVGLVAVGLALVGGYIAGHTQGTRERQLNVYAPSEQAIPTLIMEEKEKRVHVLLAYTTPGEPQITSVWYNFASPVIDSGAPDVSDMPCVWQRTSLYNVLPAKERSK